MRIKAKFYVPESNWTELLSILVCHLHLVLIFQEINDKQMSHVMKLQFTV